MKRLHYHYSVILSGGRRGDRSRRTCVCSSDSWSQSNCAGSITEYGVVDEPGLAHPGGDGEEGSGSGNRYGIERGPVNGGDVIDADFGDGGEGSAGGSDERAGAAFACGCEGFGLANGAA